MKCAFDKTRKCDKECSAYRKVDYLHETSFGLVGKKRHYIKSRVKYDECARGNFIVKKYKTEIASY